MMKNLLRRFSSARAHLIFWNTVTFALVLISLGCVFRVLAERSLLTALDREMHLQAARFRDTQHIEMLVLGDKAVGTELQTVIVSAKASAIHTGTAQVTRKFRVIEKLGVKSPDKSGQFLYRSFDLEGRPLSPLRTHVPFGLPRHAGADIVLGTGDAETYAPWDLPTFKLAAAGGEPYVDILSAGTPLRVLSLPLRNEEQIIGVVQIAAPLGQVQRDIAGLTRALLLVLPPALLVAAVAGLFLTNRALRPVKEMTKAAAGIRPDQLSRRLPVSGTDEFDELASTFNGALERVETAFADRERAISQLRRFTADASHELRTPITTIKANTGVALTEIEPSAEHVHALRQIDRAADRMTALVQDLLLLARSDAGQLKLDLGVVSLREVINDAIESLPDSEHAPISLDASVPKAVVCGDYEHLRRLFLNLLQNAVRYTPPTGRIEVSIDQTADRTLATISDTGCGIADEHLPFIGQPFYRADSGRNRKVGGAGLGLAICHSIASAHRAVIDIQSSPLKGTSVSVSFESHGQLTV